MSWGVGRRHSSGPVLLWLWLWLAAIALIRPLVWELPYAIHVALKIKKYKKFKNKIKKPNRTSQQWNLLSLTSPWSPVFLIRLPHSAGLVSALVRPSCSSSFYRECQTPWGVEDPESRERPWGITQDYLLPFERMTLCVPSLPRGHCYPCGWGPP